MPIFLSQRRRVRRVINRKALEWERRRGMRENDVSREIVDAALRVHGRFGPGLLESVYERVLAHELEKRGLRVKRQVPVFFLL